MNMNRVELTGNISRDAILRMTTTGKQVIEFGLAISDGFGDKQRTFFFDCVKWCSSQGMADYLSSALTKGAKVAVAGKLTWRSWTKEGQKRSKVEVEVALIDTFGATAKDPREYAPGKQMGLEAAPIQPAYTMPTPAYITPTQVPAGAVYDEDIPF